MKVYVVYHMYTETFCSPHESEWQDCEKTLLATTNEERANEFLKEYNRSASWRKIAEIKTYDVETD